MAHRIEVELTSQAGDSTWTWRAAGAKQPRGTVEAALVPEGSGVGTVLRAEVETTLDGTTVTALLPPKGKGDVRTIERIEILGTPQRGPDVNVVLASKSKRRRDDRSRRPSRRGPSAGRPPARASEDGDRGPRGDARSAGTGRVRPPVGPAGGPEADRSGPAREVASRAAGTTRGGSTPVQHLPQRRPGHPPARAAPGGRAAPEGRHPRRPPGHRGAEHPGPGREPTRGHPGSAAGPGRAAAAR